jgi:beta-glucosidase
VTLNEPLVPISFGYLTGKHPPGKKFHLFGFYKAFNNLVEANNRAYDIIHDHFPSAKTGVSMLSNYFKPARKWCPTEWFLAKLADYLDVQLFLKKIDDSFDFIGLQYYKMHRIVWYPPFKHNKKKKVNDMGWEVYPEGMYYELKSLARYGRPLIITENGLADEDDKFRQDFILDHLKYVHKAIGEGVKVLGYFHWSLLDNFEWAYGFGPKFGLYKIDKDTFWRTPRKSAKLYAEICKHNAVEVEKLNSNS